MPVLVTIIVPAARALFRALLWHSVSVHLSAFTFTLWTALSKLISLWKVLHNNVLPTAAARRRARWHLI